MSPEEATLWSSAIAAASGLLGAGLGALVTFFTMRQQTHVAIEAVRAQVDQARAERASAFTLAALDKRLEVHQKAYRLWTELYWNWHKENVGEYALRCQEFWYDYCLYLDATSRSSFKKILFHASTFRSYDDTMKQKVFDQLTSVGQHLTEGVDLKFMHNKLEISRIEDVQKGQAPDVIRAATDD